MNKYSCIPKVHKISDVKHSISEDWITVVANETLKPHTFIRDCELHIIMGNDNILKSLNFKHKGIDDTTDVLAFNIEPIDDFVAVDDNTNLSSGIDDFIMPESVTGLVGEVIISVEKVISQSHERGISFDQELAILIIHGILHLLGFDHQDDQDYHKMQKFADKAYSAVMNIS